jgi:hypothetical protein
MMNNSTVNSRYSVSRIRGALRLELEKCRANTMFDFGCVACVAMRFEELGYGA